jgi:hypothetical protein
MQNRNNTIEERLQIINDYIQRTMDALNATRQVVQGLSATSSNVQQGFVPQTVPGISHSSFYGVPQLVQTPYGLVAVNSQFANNVQQQLSPFNYGVNYGLQHSHFVPQFQTWPMNVQQLGIPQVLPQLGYGWNQGLSHTQFGIPQVMPQLNYGWNNGLSHTQFVPVSQIQQWPMQSSIGLNTQVVPQTVTGQTL